MESWVGRLVTVETWVEAIPVVRSGVVVDGLDCSPAEALSNACPTETADDDGKAQNDADYQEDEHNCSSSSCIASVKSTGIGFLLISE